MLILSKKKIALFLLLIGSISFLLKLSITDFSIPSIDNNINFSLRAIAYSTGDFTMVPEQNPGWPVFLSLFFKFFQSDSFLDYLNLTKLISISISSLTAIPMYLLARRFFDEKYSLVATCLFCFEPHLIYNSTFGFTEPLFISILILSAYFILGRETKQTLISFGLIGLLWWTRLEGIFLIIAFSIIFFLLNRNRLSHSLGLYSLCVIVFLIIISPIMIQRNEQYGDPFFTYHRDRIFVDSYVDEGFRQGATAANYIQENGILQFLYRFIILGIMQIIFVGTKIAFPYLIILIPFGIIFSFRAFDQNKQFIKSNWIIIIFYLAILIIPFSVITERRLLFSLFPFFIIFSTIPIQRVVEYGSSTFLFSNKQKNFLLLGILIIVLILSLTFMERYELPNPLEENEKIKLGEFIANNLDGHVMDIGTSNGYIIYAKLNYEPGVFKEFKIHHEKILRQGYPYDTGNLHFSVTGNSMGEVISQAKESGVKFLVVYNENAEFEFLDQLFSEEKTYPSLTKVFDSNEENFQYIQVKIFKIEN